MSEPSPIVLHLLRDMRALVLPEPVAEYRFCDRRWRLDIAWPDKRLGCECDGGTWSGGRHVRGAGYESDCRKINTATLMGWKVLRFTGGMVESGEAAAMIEQALATE